MNQLLAAFEEAGQTKNRPTCIVAETTKGSGFEGIEDQLDWHGKPLGDNAEKILIHLRKLVDEGTLVRPSIPKITAQVSDIRKQAEVKLSSPPNYDGKKEIATRLAHGTALEKLGRNCNYIIGLDGDTKNSTYSIKFHVKLFSAIISNV